MLEYLNWADAHPFMAVILLTIVGNIIIFTARAIKGD